MSSWCQRRLTACSPHAVRASVRREPVRTRDVYRLLPADCAAAVLDLQRLHLQEVEVSVRLLTSRPLPSSEPGSASSFLSGVISQLSRVGSEATLLPCCAVLQGWMQHTTMQFADWQNVRAGTAVCPELRAACDALRC